jgi:quercetin dioxygenase-like cupin family protein
MSFGQINKKDKRFLPGFSRAVCCFIDTKPDAHHMNYTPIFKATILLVLMYACGNHSTGSAVKEDTTGVIFPRGDKNSSDNFNGEVWVKSLVDADSLNETAVGNVTFAPGARSKWHLHPAGQILLATGGVGYYQEKGKARMILRKGDVVKCPPNIPHWHGASADSAFIQIAITGREKGPTQWLESVTDEEYQNGPKR